MAFVGDFALTYAPEVDSRRAVEELNKLSRAAAGVGEAVTETTTRLTRGTTSFSALSSRYNDTERAARAVESATRRHNQAIEDATRLARQEGIEQQRLQATIASITRAKEQAAVAAVRGFNSEAQAAALARAGYAQLATQARAGVSAQAALAEASANSTRGLGLLSAAASGAGGALGGLVSALTSPAAAIAALTAGVTLGARQIANLGDQYTSTMNRLQAATGSVQTATQVYSQLVQISAQTGASINDSAAAFQRFAIAARGIGATNSEVLTLTRTLQQAALVAGASTQEMASTTLQLGQALASGTLQGDELRAILEAMPSLAEAIARQLGVSVGELRRMGSEGQLTSERVFNAILRSSEQINEQFRNLTPTMSLAFGQLGAAMTDFVGRLDRALGLSQGIAAAAAAAANFVRGGSQRLFGTEEDRARFALVDAEARQAALNQQIANAEAAREAQISQLLPRNASPARMEFARGLALRDPQVEQQTREIQRLRENLAAQEAAIEQHLISVQTLEGRARTQQEAEAREAAARRLETQRRADEEWLRGMRERQEPRLRIEREYADRMREIDERLQRGSIDAAQADRLRAGEIEARAQALSRLDNAVRGTARSIQRAADVDRDYAQILRDQESQVNRTLTEEQRREQVLERLNQLAEQGRISEQQLAEGREAVARATEAAREREVRQAAERAARATEQALQRQQQEAERTTDRITSFFGDAFARAFENTGGGFRSLMDSFRRAAISTFASIGAQAIIRPIIAPIVQSFGGSGLGSLLGIGGGGATGAAGATGGFSLGLDQILGGVGLGSRMFGGGSLFGSGGMLGGIGNSVSGFLGQTLYNAPFGGSPSFNSIDAIGSTLGAPVSIGATLGALGGIGAGAFGIMSGIQKGGVGGAFMGAGGVAGIGAGLATLTGIGASLAPILGPLAIALPLIGMLLPGQRPSSKMQGSIVNFGYENEVRPIGFDGAKFSPENRGIADQFTASLRNQERILADLVGFRATGGFDLRVGDERGDGPAIAFEFMRGQSQGVQRFGKDEAGLRALSEYASEQLFLAFQDAAAELSTDMARIVRGSANMEQLTANAEWFRTSYEALSGTMRRTSDLGNALIALQTPFTDAIAKAQEFGLSVDGLTRNLETSVRRFLNQTLRQAQGRQFIDTMEGIIVSRGTAQSALDGREGAAQLSAIAGLQLRELFSQLTPKQLLDALANTGDRQAQIIGQQVLEQMRATAITQQRDAMDRASGRDVLVQARDIIRAFDELAPQLGALGQTELAWDSLRAQVGGFVSNLSTDQLRLLTAFDDMTNKLSDDVIRAAARTALAQREAAEAQERAAEAQAEAAREAERILAAGGGIRAYIDAQRGSASPGGPSPMAALTEAQSQFGRDLALAREGDVDALQRITGTADRLLSAGSAAYASGPQFQALREMTLASLENLPVTRSYDAMILEAIQALGGSVDVAVQVEMIRAITEQLNALPAADRAQLIQEGEVRRNIEQRIGRALTEAELAQLVAGGDITRTVAQIISAATGNPLIAPGSIRRDVLQNVETTETIVISRSIDDKLSNLLGKVDFNTRATHEVLVLIANAAQTLVNVGVLGQGPAGGLRVAARVAAHQEAGSWVKFAEGGPVTGGIPGVDSVPALMMPGEFVLRASAARALGRETLEAMNDGMLPVVPMGGGNGDVVRELRELRREVAALRGENAALRGEMRRNTSVAERTAAATESAAESTERMARASRAPVGERMRVA
ncbi:MAG TPA: tape measure protein [Roseococcus sp.]|jgi:tape measure domain-containing protein|nr:tape measure protein [Roseococcus sp.]